MGAKITIQCDYCGSSVEKSAREVRRQKKAGQQVFFCSRAHSASYWNSRCERGPLSPQALEHQRKICGNLRDSLTPFRWFLARVRSRPGESDLTLDSLRLLWERQSGICPFTGWPLILPVSTEGWTKSSPYNASLDRIDCSKRYVVGNVRFVAVIANYARNVWQDEVLIDFCRAVAANCSADNLTLNTIA